MRLILYFRCSGFRATTIWIVEQLGLAMIRSSFVNTSAFSSGTTSFFVGSILQAEELSITVMPASANLGAHSKDVPPPAEKIAMAGFKRIASVALTTLYSFPLYKTILPTDFSEATGISSVSGKFLSANTSSILVPTSPVAPTTATFIVLYGFILLKIKKPPRIRKGLIILNTQNSDTFPGEGLLGVLLCVCGNHVHSNRKINLPRFLNQIIFKK